VRHELLGAPADQEERAQRRARLLAAMGRLDSSAYPMENPEQDELHLAPWGPPGRLAREARTSRWITVDEPAPAPSRRSTFPTFVEVLIRSGVSMAATAERTAGSTKSGARRLRSRSPDRREHG
jgi:hypothetical protein